MSPLAAFHPDIVREVQEAILRDRVVIVGMRLNDACYKARKLMDANGVPHTYLEYGGYFSEWRRRLALKMWTGWPTFPRSSRRPGRNTTESGKG